MNNELILVDEDELNREAIYEGNLYEDKIRENFNIFGIAALIYACLYAFCMFRNDAGITFGLFVIGSIGYIVFCLKKLDIKLRKGSIFYIASMLLLSISTFCTDDSRIIFFNKAGILLLTISLLLEIMYDTRKWNLGKFLKSILAVCIRAIGEFCTPINDAIWYCRNKLDRKNNQYLYVLVGIVITIPVFIIVFMLLASADAVFRSFATGASNVFNVGNIVHIVFMIGIMFFASYCILTFLCKKKIDEEIAQTKKYEPLIALPVATVMTMLYIVFSVIQIVYLFLGNMELPDGYTYAEYAREGFFQLLAVSILNLIMVLIGLYYFKSNKLLKNILAVMSLCTFIMIASSAMRMIIYIQYYYLTFLRILVLWSLAVLALIFAGVMIYIFKERFPLFRYSMVIFTCFYIGLAFAHPDYLIAKVNLEGTKESRSEFFKNEYEDYYLLSELSADATPAIVEWMDDESEQFRYACIHMENIEKHIEDMGIREFNVSRYIAKSKLNEALDN